MTESPTPTGQLELRTLQQLGSVAASEWQGLRGSDHPFSSWHFLEGLERTGCVQPDRGWWPIHLTAWLDGSLVAAAPAYVKADGMGDFSRDWGYQEALQRLGGRAYPKLVVGSPFSPVTAPKILVAPDFDSILATELLMKLAREVARTSNLGSIQVLYHTLGEAAALESAGLTTRALMQYHWQNYQYRRTEDWLGRLPGRKRKQIRKEMRAPEQQGLLLQTWRGDGDVMSSSPDCEANSGDAQTRPDETQPWCSQDAARVAFDLYRTTCEKYMWGGTYLNEAFFDLLFSHSELSKSVELVTATRPGADTERGVVAGAINLATPSHLYGRYWGCHEEHKFLHFNVCLYHSIEQCIERGISIFEGGAGGEHKISRGFEPTLVYHSLWFAEDHVHEALSVALQRDAEHHRAAVSRWHEERGLDR